jgi:hypothetical protein
MLSVTAAAAAGTLGVDALSAGTAGAAVEPGGPFAATVVNVKDYGARGDGSGDDTGPLLRAIAASREGDALYFPAGTYPVSRPLRPKANQLYFSLTDRASLKAHRGRRGFSMFIVESGPVEFRHLTIDGARQETLKPREPSTAAGIWRPHDAKGALDLVVCSCRIANTHGDGIRVAGGSDSDRASDRVLVLDTVVEDCGMNGLGFGRVDNVHVESSRFEACNNGIKLLDCHDVALYGVRAVENRRHGIGFTFSTRFHVDGCFARGNGRWGIAAGGEPIRGLEPNRDFTITNNICEDNSRGGITLDPTMAWRPEKIWVQRARVSGNVCRSARVDHGIHVTHSRDVVVTDNVCSENRKGSGIQLVSSSHVLVQGNTCFANLNGIGLFNSKSVADPGHYVIGINMLYGNDYPVRYQEPGQGKPIRDVRIHGLHGLAKPEGRVRAEPGTLYEWHKGGLVGGLYVKQRGSGVTGWARVDVSRP